MRIHQGVQGLCRVPRASVRGATVPKRTARRMRYLGPMSKAYAESLERSCRWSAAAEAWKKIAEQASEVGKSESAAEAATRAADAFRRDDRPAASARMVRFALQHRAATVKDAVLLAATLGEAGEIEAAVDIATAAADGATDPASRILAVDVATGASLACGRVLEAKRYLAELARSDLPGAAYSAAFRDAQLARLDGEVDRAMAGWRGLIGRLSPHPAAAGAVASCYMEIGETQILLSALRDRGVGWYRHADEIDPAETEACFTAAGHAFTRAARRMGLYRAEAWKLSVRPADATITTALDSAMAYADERGLSGNGAEFRCLRAVIRRNPLDALHAVEMLPQAPLARGRARVLAAELGGALNVPAAQQELALDLPWRERLRHLEVATPD